MMEPETWWLCWRPLVQLVCHPEVATATEGPCGWPVKPEVLRFTSFTQDDKSQFVQDINRAKPGSIQGSLSKIEAGKRHLP
jgi:hypothetical protein